MKDFDEFIEISNDADFRRGIADRAHQAVVDSEKSEDRELTESEIAYAYSHETIVSMLALYHAWVNS